MMGGRDGASGAGGVIGRVGSEEMPAADSTDGAGEQGVVTGSGFGVGVGSLRTEGATSGRGANSATRASISRRLRPLALARAAWWFSAVRRRPSSRTDGRDISH